MSHLPSTDELQPGLVAEPFNGPLVDLDFGSDGPASDAYGDWDPSADEPTGSFDVHLGVYAID